MKRFVMGMLAMLAIGVGAVVVAVYSGMFNVSADTPHSPIVYRMIETAREQSIDRRARDLTVPADLSDAERVRRGAGNYAAMCVECHLAPGKTNSEIRMGLYPEPPDLTRSEEMNEGGPARQFWVIKHGIKASGMPAWSKGGIEDEAIWDMVAFLQQMPTLKPAQYLALVESSDGHSHGGLAHAETMHADGEPGSATDHAEGHDHSHSDNHAH